MQPRVVLRRLVMLRGIPHTKNQVLVLWYLLQDFYNLHIEINLKNKLKKKSFNY